MPCAKAPFCARCRTMNLDAGRIDRDRAPRPAVSGQRLEHGEPYALTAPAMEAVVDRRTRSVLGRTVPPAHPLRSMCTMPEITRRPSTSGAPHRLLGSKGSIRAHSASLNQASGLAIIASAPSGSDEPGNSLNRKLIENRA